MSHSTRPNSKVEHFHLNSSSMMVTRKCETEFGQQG